ncbi:hypothetical protein PHYPSEUDO_003181 [Phytophthora pseudosyringae]|uniref:RxLR effector protein n=1 Tax=Phytophthora pseudosyringae TaxID=221518 RepID=A0A8T1VV70_9STRA|nr:hypothetical protein PHYPSEUDO_003181 [Phytophthora pseudosyringae]
MHLRSAVLVLLLIAVFADCTVANSVAADRRDVSSKRFLRTEDKSTNFINSGDVASKLDEERKIGAAGVFGTVVKAMRVQAKLNIMLGRGFSPAKVIKKLKITSLNDKNFNNFARYYARYIVKYPKKAATIPATAEDAAMAVKMKQWVKERVFPQQAAQKMLAFGQKNPQKYVPQYMSLWTANQANLAAKVKIKYVKEATM